MPPMPSVPQSRYGADDPNEYQHRPFDHGRHFLEVSVRLLPPISLEQRSRKTREDPRNIQHDQDAVGIVHVLHQIVRVDQTVNGDPDTQQHHGEFQRRLQRIIDDVVHPRTGAPHERFEEFPAQKRDQFHDHERAQHEEQGDDPCLHGISQDFIFHHSSDHLIVSVIPSAAPAVRAAGARNGTGLRRMGAEHFSPGENSTSVPLEKILHFTTR